MLSFPFYYVNCRIHQNNAVSSAITFIQKVKFRGRVWPYQSNIHMYDCTCRDWIGCRTADCPGFSTWKEATASFISSEKDPFHLPEFKNFSQKLLVKCILTCRFCHENPQLYISETIFMCIKICPRSSANNFSLTEQNLVL